MTQSKLVALYGRGSCLSTGCAALVCARLHISFPTPLKGGRPQSNARTGMLRGWNPLSLLKIRVDPLNLRNPRSIPRPGVNNETCISAPRKIALDRQNGCPQTSDYCPTRIYCPRRLRRGRPASSFLQTICRPINRTRYARADERARRYP
jgi:hypothetical protein